ncbi:WD40-repeat-containing domain protein [Mycena galericulata]|nr:WD40-repeat-containing domain protein [Mycena galericulata]
MPEDGQPNDLRGRYAPNTAISSARSASSVSRGPDYLPPARTSFKRPSDRSYPASPQKRRRLNKPPRREITRELPPSCRKGAVECRRERKLFIAREIQYLQETGMHIVGYTVAESAVHFTCVDVDVLNSSLAPRQNGSQPKEVDVLNSSLAPRHMQQNERSQPKVEPLSQYLPGPQSIVSTIPGPPRFFKSGTISFKPLLPVVDEAIREAAVATRPPRAFDVDLEYLPPVAELIFGKQGLPPSKSTRASSSIAGISVPNKVTTASNSVSQPVKPLPSRSQTQAIASTHPPSRETKGQTPIGVPPSISASSDPLVPSTSSILESPLPSSDCPYEPDGDELRIPIRQQHDKLRRFLCRASASTSVIVSMYGILEGVDVRSRKHWLVAQGSNPVKEAVEDACLVPDGNRAITVLGHGRDNHQLSLINITDIDDGASSSDTGVVPFRQNQGVSTIDLKRPWNAAKKGGVSAVASMMQPLTFVSGGYDHVVHLWTLEDDLASASPVVLNIKHNSQVQSLLAIRDTSHKLVSAGADCSVHIWDLSSERVVHTIKTSNSVYHAHPTTSPFCTLLEVAHRELQFEVRDHRCVPGFPVQRFGYTCPQVHGRFMKGSTLSSCFASGDRGGRVRLWDLRSTARPRAEIECFNGQKIAHLVFQSSRLLACSENNQIRWVKYDQPL